MEKYKIDCLDKGYVKLLNISGPVRRKLDDFDASTVDIAKAARISFNNHEKERKLDQDLKLIKYLWDNKHLTPFEMVEIWFEVKLPIFIARQFMRHRTFSYNEISGRYSKLDNDWYIPEIVGGKGGSNKQGQVNCLDYNQQEEFKYALEHDCQEGYRKYEIALTNGVANEHARMFLHLNHYTTYLVKGNLRNWLHFIELRDDSHAQIEAQVYAKAKKKLILDELYFLQGII